MDIETNREGEKENDMEEENKIGEDFYYDEKELEKRVKASVIVDDVCRFKSLFGFDSEKRNNFKFITEKEIVYSSGTSYMLLELEKEKVRILHSRDGGGIGCIGIHPESDYIAVAEKGDNPSIYIYDYPDLNLYRILKKGAEKSYSHIVFSYDGNTLASVSNSPDYLLSIWDWKKQQIMLKSKAFSQEVYKIVFSEYQPDVLATMGTGHIKFWKTAETFTGLKLKGQIAKFGTQEISDVITCYHFSDGKILSSTEYGNLLLWEGNLIKCVIGETEDKGIHYGAIECIFKEGDYIVTASRDGYIKYWSHSELDNCEPDDQMNYFPKLQAQLFLGGNIVDIQRLGDQWMVYDKTGRLLCLSGFNQLAQTTIAKQNQKEQEQKVLRQQFKQQEVTFNLQLDAQIQDLTSEEVAEMKENQLKLVQAQEAQLNQLEPCRDLQLDNPKVLLKLNNGAIMGNHLSDNLMMTLSEDNKVMVNQLSNNTQLAIRQMDQDSQTKGTAMAMKPNSQLECATGYSNGILRVVVVAKGEQDNQVHIQVKKSYKVFDNPIHHLLYNPSGELLVCLSQRGEVFVLENYMPYCLLETQFNINSVVFNQLGNKLLLGLNDGRVLELKVPKMEQVDNSETYLTPLEILRQQTIKMMEFQKPKVEDMDIDFFIKKKNAPPGQDQKDPKDEEWEPKPIQKTVYYDQDCRYALAAVEGQYAGYLYVMDFVADRPIHHIQINKQPITFMHLDFKTNILMLGSSEGKVELRHRENAEEYWLQLEAHDQDYGAIMNVELSSSKSLLVSSSRDGTIRVYSLDYQTLSNQFKGMDYVENYTFLEEEPTAIKGSLLSEEQDTQDEGQYCLQQAKLLLNEDLQRKEAEKKKNIMRQKIKELRERFEVIKNENDKKEKVLRLTEDQMEVDEEFQTMFKQRMEGEVEETRKVVEYDIQYNKVKTQKIRKYMIDELVIDKFAVKVIGSPKIQVKTFKLQKMSTYLQENLENNYKEIEEQQQNERDEQIEKKEEQQIKEKGEQEKDRFDLDLEELEKEYDLELENRGLKEGAQKRKEKRRMLEERINQAIAELKKEEPTREAFDPDHKKEIAEAYSKFGDYKLKNAKEYVVPENQRMNVSKKRKHLFLLEEFIYNSKLKFNNEVIQLRELKKFIAGKVKESNEAIREINKKLGIEEELREIVIDKESEYPESKLEIEEEMLEEKESEKEQMNGEEEQKKKIERPLLQVSTNIKNRKGYKLEKSEMEKMNDKIEEMRLKSRKKKLKDEMDKQINDFDIEVVKLSNEKNIIEGDLMVAKMKLVTFYQELLILEDMEEKDNSLIEDLVKLRKEKQSLEEQTIQVINNLLAIKENEVRIEKTLADLMKQFKELVHQDDDVARNKIHEHYRKQFKQKKAKQIKQLNDDEELNEEEEDDEEEDEGYDQEDDEDKPDTTPIESDPKSKEILESIVQNEDEQETNKKNRQDLETTKKMINNKTNQLAIRLENTENELKDYQRVKLQKLNKIDVSIVLHLNQIQNIQPIRNTHIAPDDLNSSVLFTETELTKLNNRIVQLQQEKNKIQSNKNHLKRKKNHIDKELDRLQAEYIKMEKDYEEKHMLKFGYIMDKDKKDLKFLEAFEPNKQLLEMRQKYKQEENASIRKIEEAQKQLIETKKELLQAKKENTGIIQSITDLGKQQIALNKTLDLTKNKLFKQSNEDLKMSNERDKKNLKELINFLNKLINELKEQIGIFRRKGGHIYTYVNNNTKQ